MTVTTEAVEWDRFVAGAPGGHHVQTDLWSRTKPAGAWRPRRLVIREGNRVVAGAQVLCRRIPGLGEVGYLDRGPLLSDPDLAASTLDRFLSWSRQNRLRVVIIQPPHGEVDWEKLLVSRGAGRSFVKASLAATTRIDLGRDEEAILGAMRSKTRYNIRKGLRSRVEVRAGGRPDMEVFHEMLGATATRQGFVVAGLAVFQGLWDVLSLEGNVEMLLAEVDGRPVAGILLVKFGDTVVFKRGAWTGESGEAHPNEVLHWTAIQRARTEGFRWYDFDGIEADVADRILAGEGSEQGSAVTRFKLGFGGEVVRFAPAMIWIANPVLRWGHDRLLPRVSRMRIFKRMMKKARVG